VEECLQALASEEPPTVAFVFVSDSFSLRYEELFQALKAGLPGAIFLGSSASGLVGLGEETEFKPGLSLLCGWLPEVEVFPFHLDSLPDLDAPPEAWQQAMGTQGRDDIKGLILLADPFSFEADNALAGIDFAYPGVPKVGGLSSGCQKPGQAALFCAEKLHRRGCVGLALAGAIELSPAVCQGCKPFGEQYVVTAVRDNVILELSGKPATDALDAVLKGLTVQEKRDHIQTAIFVGLGAGRPALTYGPGDFLVRQVLGADKRRGALVVGGRVRLGQTLQFHLRNDKTSRFDLKSVLTKTLKSLPGQVAGALLFSCLGRGQALYKMPSHDSKVFQSLAGDVPLSGFFCNGEIGPVNDVTSLHGFTSSFAIFSH